MKRIKGFTLLEAVFAIAVTILCAQILFGLVNTLRKINHQKSGINESFDVEHLIFLTLKSRGICPPSSVRILKVSFELKSITYVS